MKKSKIIVICIAAALAVAVLVMGHLHMHKKNLIARDEAALMNTIISEAQLGLANAGKAVQFKAAISDETLAKEYPAAFDLRSVDTDGDGVMENYVTSVKYQNPFGSCWAFAAMSAAETSILFNLKQDAVTTDAEGNPRDSLDLSEHHLAWFTYTPIPEDDAQAGEGLYSQVDGVDQNLSLRLNSGSTQFAAASVFASGMGPVAEPDFDTAAAPESQLNYHGTEMLTTTNETTGFVTYSKEDDWSVDESQRYRQTYMMENAYYLNTPVSFDENGNYDTDYADMVAKSYKEQIMNGRAVSISYCSDNYMPYKVNKVARYINNDTWAHYCYEPVRSTHAVTIIGWDDNYSRENFLTEVQQTYGSGEPAYTADGKPAVKSVNQPPKDGAWIVKNSWGALDSISSGLAINNWGIDGTGYFYLSYYDQSIETAQCFDFDVENRLKGELGEYVLEEHDMMPSENPHCIHYDFPVSEANVFAAEENEILKAVSCTTTEANEEVTFRIYLIDGDMIKGKRKLVEEFTETFPYPGLHVLNLPTECNVEKGQKVAVCLTQKCGDRYIISSGTEFSKKAYDAKLCDDSYAAVAVVNPGESYIYLNESNTWKDFAEIKEKLENMDGATSYYAYDNFPIKLYASIVK